MHANTHQSIINISINQAFIIVIIFDDDNNDNDDEISIFV
jgi:hypothetical protein